MKKISFHEGWYFASSRGSWHEVILPHDAMIHQCRASGSASGDSGAYFYGGKYLYKKWFDRPAADHIHIQFEGIYKNVRVWINEKLAAEGSYGYSPISIRADKFLFTKNNLIMVECENLK